MSTTPQGWQTPKTNWQAADIVHPSDFNRIESNIQFIESGSRTLDPSQAPSGNSGSLRQILSWFANRIKAITGKANWYDAPDITLATLAARLDYVPPGAVMAFARSTPPDGWLECNGQAVSRTTYADLFGAIGTTFGAGNGSTTFNVPDLRGEFIRGWDHGRGVDSGRALGSWQADAFQGHWHNLWTGRNDNTAYHAPGSVAGHVGELFPAGWDAGNNYVRNPVTDNTNGAPRTASETRPRNVALMYCIKY